MDAESASLGVTEAKKKKKERDKMKIKQSNGRIGKCPCLTAY